MLPQGFDHTLQWQKRNIFSSLTGLFNLFSFTQTTIRKITQLFDVAALLVLDSNYIMAQTLAFFSSIKLVTKPAPLY